MRSILLRGLCLLACLSALFSPPGFAQGGPVPEYALKAALLFKLPPFVYRPEMAPGEPISMCLLGSNPFGSTLERLAQTPIDGRAVKVERLEDGREAANCHFVFVSRSEAGELDSVLRRLARHPVVTVSDIEGFARAGGMVELALGTEGSAITILINRQAGQKQGIEFNAQLLRLARMVTP